jgi:hypothetical protein
MTAPPPSFFLLRGLVDFSPPIDPQPPPMATSVSCAPRAAAVWARPRSLSARRALVADARAVKNGAPRSPGLARRRSSPVSAMAGARLGLRARAYRARGNRGHVYSRSSLYSWTPHRAPPTRQPIPSKPNPRILNPNANNPKPYSLDPGPLP